MKLSAVFKLLPEKIAYAHCDIPCGIYDPHNAQMAAHTIIRMTELLQQVVRDDETKAEHDIARMTHVKEEHSGLLEDELSTLQDDYFKNDFSKFPQLSDLFKEAKTLGTKVRVGIDMESAKELLEKTMQIAEIFYKSKNLESARVKAPYPTGLDIVVQR